jgi:hypothetical protein
MTPARRSHRRESAEAVGFALKDIISNVVSGMLILGLRPFEIGDEIAIGDIEGTVQRIRLGRPTFASNCASGPTRVAPTWCRRHPTSVDVSSRRFGARESPCPTLGFSASC